MKKYCVFVVEDGITDNYPSHISSNFRKLKSFIRSFTIPLDYKTFVIKTSVPKKQKQIVSFTQPTFEYKYSKLVPFNGNLYTKGK